MSIPILARFLKKENKMSKIQCPKCKKWFQIDLMAQVYNCEIPKHNCVDDEPIRSEDDQDNIAGQINNINYDISVFSSDDSSYSSDSNSNIDTSSSDIGGGGDFGGAGASSDY